ncbi:MAG: hypothetical protein ACTSP9_04545 [Promethearchaeota archaeon]
MAKNKKKRNKDSGNVMEELREKLFKLNPKSIDITPSEELPRVWGFMMEIVISQTWITLVCIADGTVSIYMGTGGGIIGAGEHNSVRIAARECLKKAEEILEHLKKFDHAHLQIERNIKFHVLTYDGIRSDEVETDEIESEKHYLSELYYYAQNVITEVRLVEGSA